ncbi:hypothetical protein SEA_BIPPER_112 [Mycobacterium phage Bipper]|uniref:Lipoprotein n=1 Tax=Mycobacterium phage Bipper TaxID=1805457 RepID=A0A142F2P0_9CAUD|nr:hypothetical protein KCH39_gp065 [Mycobacterium phage Bipper]AMQ67047.1 hypothetical protein SEA_BIPPER_112 [Mycobacterium phage Bipper]
MGRTVAVIAAAAAILAGCGQQPTAAPSTVTVTETRTVTAAPTAEPAAAPAAPSGDTYRGNGVYAVGQHPHSGLKAAMPPGRYTVSLMDDQAFGTWARCSDVLCGSSYPDNVIGDGIASGVGYSEVVEVLPSDVAVYLFNVRFTSVT